MTIYDSANQPHQVFVQEDDIDANFMAFLVRHAPMSHMPRECNGKKTCGTCAVDINSTKSIARQDKEEELMRINGTLAENRCLSCFHKICDVIDIEDSTSGCAVQLPRPSGSL
jgi:hypothetical protein